MKQLISNIILSFKKRKYLNKLDELESELVRTNHNIDSQMLRRQQLIRRLDLLLKDKTSTEFSEEIVESPNITNIKEVAYAKAS